jgi:hypothetical protein
MFHYTISFSMKSSFDIIELINGPFVHRLGRDSYKHSLNEVISEACNLKQIKFGPFVHRLGRDSYKVQRMVRLHQGPLNFICLDYKHTTMVRLHSSPPLLICFESYKVQRMVRLHSSPHYQTVFTCLYLRIFASAVTSFAPKLRAVATIIRSAGSE